jgi:hypothetical protein
MSLLVLESYCILYTYDLTFDIPDSDEYEINNIIKILSYQAALFFSMATLFDLYKLYYKILITL